MQTEGSVLPVSGVTSWTEASVCWAIRSARLNVKMEVAPTASLATCWRMEFVLSISEMPILIRQDQGMEGQN